MSAPATPRRTMTVVDRFGGIERRACARAGDFADSCNMDCAAAPALTSAPVLRILDADVDGGVLPVAADGVGWVDGGGELWYRGADTGFRACTAEGERFAAVLGDIALFFPDKTWYDFAAGAGGDIEFARTGSADLMVTYADEVIPPAIYSTFGDEPVSPPNSALWIRHGGGGGTSEAYRYYQNAASWELQTTLHYRFAFTGVGAGVRAGETVTVSRLVSTSGAIGAFAGNYRVYHAAADALILSGGVNYRLLADLRVSGGTHFTVPEVKIERRVPDLCCAVAAGERIWGASSDGSAVYSCAAGDPFTWNAFHGEVADSCKLGVGVPGAFTGASSRGGDPVFFKENAVLRLRGSRPDNFELEQAASPGLSRLSPRGICRLDDGVYYAAPDGRIYRWAGGAARPVSDPTGRAFSGVCLGGAGRLLIVSDGTQGWEYDTDRALWRRFLPAPARTFAYGGAVYLVCAHGEGYALLRRGGMVDDDLGDGEELTREWSAQTAAFAPGGDHGCVPSELLLDMESDGGAPVEIGFIWDGERTTVWVERFSGRVRRTVALPQRYCSTVAVTVSGSGSFALRSLSVRASARG